MKTGGLSNFTDNLMKVVNGIVEKETKEESEYKRRISKMIIHQIRNFLKCDSYSIYSF